MFRFPWMHNFWKLSQSRSDRRRRAARQRRRVRPTLESLEERLTPSYNVLTLSSVGPMAANQPSEAIAVQLQDNKGNAVTATSNQTVQLRSSSSTGEFLDVSGKQLANSSIVIPAGSSFALFEYEDSQTGQAGITAEVKNTSVFGELAVTVQPVLAFTTPSRVTAVNQPSQSITVQLQDGNGNPIKAASNTTVSLLSSSSVQFLDTSGKPLANNSLTIAAGSSSASFEIKDSLAGDTPNISASTSTGTGLLTSGSSASQTEYVGVVGAISTSGTSLAVGQPSKMSIQLENAVTSSTTISLSSTSSGGQFLDTSGNPLPHSNGIYSLTIAAGSSSASFAYEDSQTGTADLTAASTALNLSAFANVQVGEDSLAIVSPQQTLAPSQPSQLITVQLLSNSNPFFGGVTNALTATSPVTIKLTSSSSTGKFLDSSGKALASNTITIAAGASSASFEYEDSQEGFPTLTVSGPGGGSGITQTERVGQVSLTFTTAAQSLTTGKPSGTITVQLTDSSGKAVAAASDLTIYLSSNSFTGKFLDTSGKPLSSNSIAIAAGASSASFEYEDSVGGTPTLLATASNVSASQQETVAGPYTLGFTSPSGVPFSLGQSIPLNTPSQPIAVQLLDSSNSPVKTTSAVIVNLSSSSSGGQFLDTSGKPLSSNTVTIAAGASSASFEYEDSKLGFATLTASENGFKSQQSEAVGVNLAFTTSPQTLTAGKTSQPLTVQLQDSSGKAITLSSDVNVFLSSSLQGTQFLDTSGKPLTFTSLTIPAGSSSASFEINSTWGGTADLSASASALNFFGVEFSATQKETVQGLSALAFTTSAQTLTAGQTSQTVTLQLQDNNGKPANAPSGGLAINLSGSSLFGSLGGSGLTFFDANGKSLGTGNATITMAAGSSTVSFKFEGTTAGTSFIEASVTNGFSQEQGETIQAGAPNAVVFVTPTQSLVAGVPSGSIEVQLQDKYGNVTQAGSGGLTLTLSSSSSSGKFLTLSGNSLANSSITIPQGASSAAFVYQDSQSGTPTLTVTATGLKASQQETILSTATEIHVTNTNDSGTGSLRAAILAANANPGSTIVVDSGVSGTIDLLSDLPNLQASTIVLGPGANLLTLEPGSSTAGSFGGLGIGTPAPSVFSLFGTPTTLFPPPPQPIVTITGLTVANFNGTGITNYGSLTLRQVDVSDNQETTSSSITTSGLLSEPAGGIGNVGTLTVLDSTVANNSTTGNDAAGGINSTSGSLVVINSTIAGNADNSSSGTGSVFNGTAGGIGIFGGTAYIANSTISGNTAAQNAFTSSGGGIDNESGRSLLGLTLGGSPVTLYDTIVAGNTGSPTNPTDVSGVFASLGNNLIGEANSQSSGFVKSDLVGTVANPIDAKLGPLANNGGPTPTMGLLAGSPALGAGSSVNAPATDQRGDPRPTSGAIDIGAFEGTTTSHTSGPSITGDPSNQSVIAGESATFTASASGNPTPTVQWQISKDGGKSFSDLSGATSTTLTLSNVTTAMNGFQYRAEFSNSVSSATTTAATLTVSATASKPVITGNPISQSAVVGASATFTASASGNPTPTVQWQISKDGGKSFSNLSGATSTTLTLDHVNTSLNGAEYRAVFSNSAGSAATNAATLTVVTPPPPSLPPAPPPAPPTPPTPPHLNPPPLLALFDQFLGGVETVNADGSVTVRDSIFGIPLLVANFSPTGGLESVTLFGINVTFLFELL